MISSASGTAPSADRTFVDPETPPQTLALEPIAQTSLTKPSAAVAVAPTAITTTGAPSRETGAQRLPLALLRHLLEKVSQLKLSQIADLAPALRILALALTAGLVLKITAAVIGSINELPLLGGLLELVGLIKMVQLLSRHALKQQKRAELLGRIQELKRQLLG